MFPVRQDLLHQSWKEHYRCSQVLSTDTNLQGSMSSIYYCLHQVILLLYNRQDSKLPNYYLPDLRFQVFHLLPMLYLQDHCNLLLHL